MMMIIIELLSMLHLWFGAFVFCCFGIEIIAIIIIIDQICGNGQTSSFLHACQIDKMSSSDVPI